MISLTNLVLLHDQIRSLLTPSPSGLHSIVETWCQKCAETDDCGLEEDSSMPCPLVWSHSVLRNGLGDDGDSLISEIGVAHVWLFAMIVNSSCR